MLSRLNADEFSGLFPRSILILDSGYSKEEVKAGLFDRMASPSLSDSVLTLDDLVRKLVGMVQPLSTPTRVEAIDQIFKTLHRKKSCPALQRLKRRRHFSARLDRAIQSVRMDAATVEEESVFLSILKEKQLDRETHLEIFQVARIYEAWLEQTQSWDLPRMYAEATRILQGTGWPSSVYRPEQWRIVDSVLETRLGKKKAFLDELKRWGSVIVIPSESPECTPPVIEWRQAHTAWDAAESLVRDLFLKENPEPWSDVCIVFSETLENRLALWKTFERYGIPLSDPRNPIALSMDERPKQLLLPFELISSRFERDVLIRYFRSKKETTFPVRPLLALGLQRGCPISPYREWIETFRQQWMQKRPISEWKRIHFQWLQEGGFFTNPEDSQWIRFVFEDLWEKVLAESELLEYQSRPLAPLVVLERLRDHLSGLQIRPPVLRARGGARLYRVGQSPLEDRIPKVILFGVNPSEWEGLPQSDFYLNARERNVLHVDFGITSPETVRKEKKRSLSQWIRRADQLVVYDVRTSLKGSENPDAATWMGEFVGLPNLGDPRFMPLQRPWKESFRSISPVPAQSVYFPHGPEPLRVSATELDRYSRCPFLALAGNRWKLWDLREPSMDPYPEVRGMILHDAVKRMLHSWKSGPRESPAEAMHSVLEHRRLEGLLDSDRLRRRFIAKSIQTLEIFSEKESVYQQRSQAVPEYLETIELEEKFSSGSVYGKPDRIDRYQDGYFLIDYKTSSSSAPTGPRILEKGYWLQLPFYALATQTRFGKPVYGLQFIELNSKGGRTHGIFFPQWNGKEDGKLTAFTKAVKSVLPAEPEEIWNLLRGHIDRELKGMQDGQYSPIPKDPEDCVSCPMKGVCGFQRKMQ